VKRFEHFLLFALLVVFGSGQLNAQTSKPNILVIMGDDVGIYNLSTYHQGMMGYSTPNIDRIANEGGKFMNYYAQQSCTAGRSAFITGQLPFRTGLSKVGLPGADLGLRKEDPTIAELLKPITASMSSSETSITSMLRKSQRTRIIRRVLNSKRSSVPVV
jgi:hypothetical protein